MSQTSFGSHSLVLSADYIALRDIGQWLDTVLATRIGEPFIDRRGEIELAVHELAVNIVDHAFSDQARPGASFEITAQIIDNELFVRTFDAGDPVAELPDPPNACEPQVRGYGLMIVEQLASSVHYQRSSGSNRWTLCFDPGPPL